MKRYLHTFLVASCLALTGCLQITEELFLEADGSGRYETRIDASKMLEMVELAKNFLPDSLQNAPELSGSGLNDSLLGISSELDKIPGIYAVERRKQDGGVQTMSFRFRDVQALNRALRTRIAPPPGNISTDSLNIFTFQKGRLVWSHPLPDAMAELSGAMPADQGLNPDMLRNMAGDMTFTTILHLPGRITDHTNRKAKLGEDGKSITVVTDLFDKESLRARHNDIKFK
jgi:hypothetical protein